LQAKCINAGRQRLLLTASSSYGVFFLPGLVEGLAAGQHIIGQYVLSTGCISTVMHLATQKGNRQNLGDEGEGQGGCKSVSGRSGRLQECKLQECKLQECKLQECKKIREVARV
jgi:hypothetical protein